MKLLIIGSSYIYRAPNGNQQMTVENQFETLARIGGQDLDLTATYLGGGSVLDHWNDDFRINAQDEIRTGNYDVVVMNGADEPGFNEYSNRFARLIDQNGGDLVMNGIWIFDSGIDASGSPDNRRMHEEYRDMALRHDAGYAPNGLSMTRAHSELTKRYGNGDNGETAEDMLTTDAIHGTALANYMMAHNMYRAVFGETPPPATQFRPAGVSLSDAQLIEQINNGVFRANGISLDGNAAPNPGPPPPPPPPPPEPEPDPQPQPVNPRDPENAIIRGRVFDDRDGDGIEDRSENGIANVTVQLLADGGVVRSVESNAKGYYYLGNLAADDYQIRFIDTKPDLKFSPANREAENKDSDVVSVSGNFGTTARFSLDAGEVAPKIGAGLMPDGAPSPTPQPPAPQPPAPQPGNGDIFTVNRANYDTEVIGSGASQTLRGTGGDDYMLGLNGNDTVRGYRGDDFIDGGGGRDRLFGDIGEDVFVFDRNDAAINGGSQIDRILFHKGGWQDARQVDISFVEIFDMRDGGRDTMTITFDQTRAGRDRPLEIFGDDGDVLRIETERGGEALGTFRRDGEEMTRYRIDFSNFAVDSDVDVYVDNVLIS